MKRVVGSALALVAILALGCGGSSSGTSTSGSSGTSATGGTTGSTAGTSTTGTSGDATVIATGLNDPQDLAVDSSNAYWTDKPHSGAGSVMKVALSGGQPAAVVSNVTEPAQIAVDGTSIYWIAGDASNNAATVNKANLDGSGASAIASGLNPDQDTRLVVVSGTVYWGGSDGIRSAGSSGSTLLVPTSGAALLAADSTGVYWREINVNTFGYDIKHADLTGQNTITLGSTDSSNSLVGFATDGSNAYWATRPVGGDGSTIYQVAIGGGTPTTFATYTDDIGEIAADSSGVYLSDQSGGDNGIYKVSGGSATLLQGDTAISTAAASQRNLRLDASNIYFFGGGFNDGQAVLHKIAR